METHTDNTNENEREREEREKRSIAPGAAHGRRVSTTISSSETIVEKPIDKNTRVMVTASLLVLSRPAMYVNRRFDQSVSRTCSLDHLSSCCSRPVKVIFFRCCCFFKATSLQTAQLLSLKMHDRKDKRINKWNGQKRVVVATMALLQKSSPKKSPMDAPVRPPC